jgi:pSer/pThr/pTyr-binding forkhead associated (FHA) protein
MLCPIWGKLIAIDTQRAPSLDIVKYKVCSVIHLEVTIGRLLSNDVQIKNPRISPYHCLIEYEKEVCYLTDISS